jgi:hypothetical protein
MLRHITYQFSNSSSSPASILSSNILNQPQNALKKPDITTCMEKYEASEFIKEKILRILDHQEQEHSCAACHIIFSLKDKTGKSEQDCADMLSEILTDDPKLNQEFIEMVEQIHMRERNMGGTFAMRERESKDSYLEAYFANVIDELASDLTQQPHRALIRKILLAYISLYIAQTIGVDYHAATEELYYLVRKDERKNLQIDELISKIESKVAREHT